MSTSSATGIVVAEIHAELEQSPGHTTSRQPSATAAAARLPPEGNSQVTLNLRLRLLAQHKPAIWVYLLAKLSTK